MCFLAVPRTEQHLNVLDIVELNEGHYGAESGDNSAVAESLVEDSDVDAADGDVNI